jgi:hypothetical protein
VYETEIPQEDGTDKMETVDEAKNLVQVTSLISNIIVIIKWSNFMYV